MENPDPNAEQQSAPAEAPTSGAEAPASTPPEAPQVDPTTADAPQRSDELASDGEQVKEGVEEGDADAQ